MEKNDTNLLIYYSKEAIDSFSWRSTFLFTSIISWFICLTVITVYSSGVVVTVTGSAGPIPGSELA